MAGTHVDDESIVGDECHIVSAVPGGPRHDPSFARERLDEYSNLLLACKVHHKLIDDQELQYTASRLTNLKASHEEWVSEQLESIGSHTQPLQIHQVPETTPAFLPRIRAGKEILAIVTDASAYASHYDDLRNETEDELVASFLQDVQDWGELGLESMSDRMRAARSLDEHIRELGRAGFWVFGCCEQQILEGGTGPETDWTVAHIRVLRNSNAEIILIDDRSKQGETDVR